jgi:hypothetical protein
MLGAQSVSDRRWSAEDKPCKIHTSIHKALRDSNVNFCADQRQFERAPIAYALWTMNLALLIQ